MGAVDFPCRILVGPWRNVLGKDIYYRLIGLVSFTVSMSGLRKGTCLIPLPATSVVKSPQSKYSKKCSDVILAFSCYLGRRDTRTHILVCHYPCLDAAFAATAYGTHSIISSLLDKYWHIYIYVIYGHIMYSQLQLYKIRENSN